MACPEDEIDSEEDYDGEREMSYVHDVLGAISRSRGVFLKSVKDVYKNIYGTKTCILDICNVMEQNPEQTIKALCCSRSRAPSRISRRTDFSHRLIANAVEEITGSVEQIPNDDYDAVAQRRISRPSGVLKEHEEKSDAVDQVQKQIGDDGGVNVSMVCDAVEQRNISCPTNLSEEFSKISHAVEQIQVEDGGDVNVSFVVEQRNISLPSDVVEELAEISNAIDQVQVEDGGDVNVVSVPAKDILRSVSLENVNVHNEELTSNSRSAQPQTSADIASDSQILERDSVLPFCDKADESEFVDGNAVSTPEVILYHGGPLKPEEEDPELFILAEHCHAPISRDLSTLEHGCLYAVLESFENFSPEDFFLVVPSAEFSQKKISDEVSVWSTRFKIEASISNFEDISVGLPVLYGQCSSYTRGVITNLDSESRTATVRLIDSGRLEHMVTVSCLRRMSVAHSKWPGIAVRCSLGVATVNNKSKCEDVLKNVRVIAANWVKSIIIVPACKDDKNRCILDLFREKLGVYSGSSLRKYLVRKGYAVYENRDDGLSVDVDEGISDEDNTTLSDCGGSITLSIPSSPDDSNDSYSESDCKPEKLSCDVTTRTKVVYDYSSGEVRTDVVPSHSYQLTHASLTDVVAALEKSIDDVDSIKSGNSIDKKKATTKSRFGFGKRSPSSITGTAAVPSVVEEVQPITHGDAHQFNPLLNSVAAVKVSQKGAPVPSRFRLNK